MATVAYYLELHNAIWYHNQCNFVPCEDPKYFTIPIGNSWYWDSRVQGVTNDTPLFGCILHPPMYVLELYHYCPPQSCNTMLNQVNKVNYLHLNLILDQRDSHGPNKVCRTLNLRCVILLSDQFIILCIVIRFLCDSLYCPCVTLMIKILRMCLHRGHLCWHYVEIQIFIITLKFLVSNQFGKCTWRMSWLKIGSFLTQLTQKHNLCMGRLFIWV